MDQLPPNQPTNKPPPPLPCGSLPLDPSLSNLATHKASLDRMGLRLAPPGCLLELWAMERPSQARHDICWAPFS